MCSIIDKESSDFLDSTNKNVYRMSWVMEYVGQGFVDYFHMSFMIAGHTKFDVDRAFSATAKAYNAVDVFTPFIQESH